MKQGKKSRGAKKSSKFKSSFASARRPEKPASHKPAKSGSKFQDRVSKAGKSYRIRKPQASAFEQPAAEKRIPLRLATTDVLAV